MAHIEKRGRGRWRPAIARPMAGNGRRLDRRADSAESTASALAGDIFEDRAMSAEFVGRVDRQFSGAHPIHLLLTGPRSIVPQGRTQRWVAVGDERYPLRRDLRLRPPRRPATSKSNTLSNRPWWLANRTTARSSTWTRPGRESPGGGVGAARRRERDRDPRHANATHLRVPAPRQLTDEVLERMANEADAGLDVTTPAGDAATPVRRRPGRPAMGSAPDRTRSCARRSTIRMETTASRLFAEPSAARADGALHVVPVSGQRPFR